MIYFNYYFLGVDILENNIIIDLKNISMEYGNEKVLDNINLYIRDKEFVTLLGPSGCGKTTTLRIIGGFINQTSGNVYFEGKEISKVPPYKRQLNTVFQKYALFSHLNVFENVAFGLRLKKGKEKLDEKVIKEKVSEMLKLVNLSGYEKRDINSLSGGQQQRVAIARALVNHPKVLLLDEPLGALDLKLRKDMQTELKKIQQRLGITFIYVTHDQEEALSMSDTIVVMNEGKIQQIGTPQDIYNEPKNAFVADFIGESNILDGIMKKDCLVNIFGQDIECVDVGFEENESVDVVIRPEDIIITSPEEGIFSGTVTSLTFKGVHFEMVIQCDGFEFLAHNTIASQPGEKIGLKVKPFDFHIMKKSKKECEK